MPDLASLFMEHIAALLDFHQDDDSEHQLPDPVDSWRYGDDGNDRRTLIVRLKSGAQVVLRVDDGIGAGVSS